MLISLLVGYFVNFSIKNISVVNFIDRYLGIIAIPLFVFALIYGTIFLIENKVKREVREIKWYLFLFLFFLLVFLFILYKSGVHYTNYESILIDESFYRQFLNKSLYEYKLGYFFTYLFYLILGIKIKFELLLLTIFVTIGVIFFLIVFGPIRKYIKKETLRRKEKYEEERKEKLLQEQIKIKEELDRKVTIKKMKFKENQEKIMQEKIEAFKLEKIRIERFRESVKLKKTITLEDEDK